MSLPRPVLSADCHPQLTVWRGGVAGRLLWLLLALSVAAHAGEWSPPITLVEAHGRLAIGNQLHVVGHSGANLVHRRSNDGGTTWTTATTIAAAATNFPMQYGGLFAVADTLYLLTAAADMGPSARHLDFRRSTDNGLTWTALLRLTTSGQELFRAQLVVSGAYVHVGGQGAPSTGTSWYFRSANGGTTWDVGRLMASGLGSYGGGQTIAADGATVHLAYTATRNGVGAGDTMYRRSNDNGTTWSTAISIGEVSSSSDRQARVQLEADSGRVFASWQREASIGGGTLPADRLGYNTSANGGVTWGTARILPFHTGVDRNHQQTWMTVGGDVHLIWRHGDTADDPTGYLYSSDYGQTWSSPEFAIDTVNAANHPYSLVADTQRVHALAGPLGAMQYAYRAGARPINLTPVVNAGPDRSVTIPAAANLSGTVSDDGLPTGATVTSSWTKVSGPGTVTFASATTPATTATFSAAGTYVLRLTASDKALSANDQVQVNVTVVPPTNQAPLVTAGPDRAVDQPNAAALVGTVTDDGLPSGSSPTTSWTKLSGPGNVVFANAAAASTTATFSISGTYVLRLTASDGSLNSSDDVQVLVNALPPTNVAPVVNAGSDTSVMLPGNVLLAGTAIDDGLPTGSSVVVTWSTVSGPGTVTFSPANAGTTTAAFPAPGTYVARLTANDGSLTGSDEVTIVVTSTTSTPPTVNSPASSSGGCGVGGLAAALIALLISATTNLHLMQTPSAGRKSTSFR